LGTFLRDTGNVVQVVVQLLFFATPVTYPLSKLGPTARKILLCNPLTMMIVNFRRCVTEGLPPDGLSYAVSLLIAVVAAMAGYWWFMKLKRAFADVI
jgi:lipopolysaccharide transport system permease protein